MLVSLIKDILVINDIVECFTFSWLKYKQKQEIDIWVPSLKLAIEYDGRQHFEPVQFGGISLERARQNLIIQKSRDKNKNKLIKQHYEEIKYFIRFNYREKITKELVETKLKNKGVL